MKKILSLIAAAALSLTLAVTAAAECESAHEAIDNINVGWNLGNTFDCVGDWISGGPSTYETAWGNPAANKQIIEGVKAAGFNTIRLPVSWGAHIDDNGNIDKAWLDRVQEVVDYIIDADLYCVLNVHHDGGGEGWIVASDECVKKYGKRIKGLWTNIAERFKNYDEKLIFESYNEVVDSAVSWTGSTTSDGYSAMNELNQMFVDAVRATGENNADRNLMVQTYCGGSSSAIFKNFVLPKDTVEGHLIVQVHNYDPLGFTWNNATWTTMSDTFSESMAKGIAATFKRYGKVCEELGVPMVVGEFGSMDKGNSDQRAKHASCFVAEAAKYGIKCFWWDNGYAPEYKIFDRNTGAITQPEVVKALVSNAVGKYNANDPDAKPDKALKGDVNGDGWVTAKDASDILKYAVGLVKIDVSVADFNGDGGITARDATDILKYTVGLL